MPKKPTTVVTGRRKILKVKVTKSVRPAKLKPTTKAAMMNVVNRILNRKSETKYLTDYSSGTGGTYNKWTGFNSQIVGAGQWGYALPQCVQGDNDYQRIGDSIVPTSCKTDLYFRLAPQGGQATQQNPVDITVVVFYGYCKKYKSLPDVTASSSGLSAQLLRVGQQDATTTLETKSFDGNIVDLTYPINDVVWHLKRKSVRLYKAPGVLNGGTASGVLSSGNKGIAHMRLDFTKMLPSKLKYDDATDTYPSNFAPVWAAGYYYNDATAADAGGGIVQLSAYPSIRFKDM